MKLNIRKAADIVETEITIKCREIDVDLKRIIDHIKGYGLYIKGRKAEATALIKPNDIFYFESVDDKTYLYCEKEVFSCDYKLYELEKLSCLTSFCRVSKACILNIDKLQSFKSCINSRIEAVLTNEEHLMVNRRYVKILKDKLDEMRCAQ